ncbi:hypothetical protein K438DRAFT_1984884 [Mycena galopus ATCC 62051]|nr:hypothetical protein K438DRAFT_1984884 [Mycena galopus ATCC 62051]
MKQPRRKGLLATAACLAWVAGSISPPVKVTLESSWPAPPLLLEIIETVVLENGNVFFPFVDRVTDPDVVPQQALTQEATHQYALQVAAVSGSWVDWYGTVVCDVGTLAKLVGIETIEHAPENTDAEPSE